jgi:hypothetical protein
MLKAQQAPYLPHRQLPFRRHRALLVILRGQAQAQVADPLRRPKLRRSGGRLHFGISGRLNFGIGGRHQLGTHGRLHLGEGGRLALEFAIAGCPAEWANLPIPEGRIVVGLDGGYVRNWDDRKTNFELIVGRSLPEDRDARYIGLVHGYDRKPKRRLFEHLLAQGMQANQDLTFLTDGGEEVRALTERLAPESEHVLDWFHIAMRLTVLEQYARGISHHDKAEGERLLTILKRVKWLLWHGNVHRALEEATWLHDCVSDLELDYPHLRKSVRAAREFLSYIHNNTSSLINYGDRFRSGERISSAMAESTVNAVISKRFAKRQQMQWTRRGAHLLLQTRTRALDGTLRPLFERWYPGLANDNADQPAQPAAA